MIRALLLIWPVMALSIASGVLYRLGGIGRPFRTWMRDWLVPGVSLLTLLLYWQPQGLEWLWVALFYVANGGALTTYWDWLSGYDNFYAHGLAIGLSALFLAFAEVGLVPVLLRSVVIMSAMGAWSDKEGNADIEEFGRGFICTATIPILWIGL